MNAIPGGRKRLTVTQWLIVSLAAIGFAFDIYELLMMQFIIKDLITELTEYKPGSDGFLWWASVLFYVPALAGGVFGLFGGYLTDLLGRRRVLTWSILIYAISAFAAGFSTSIEMLLILRCATFVGVCVEFVAAVAWLAELFPDPRQRENVLSYTQAFSSLGGFLVAGAYWIAARHAADWPTIQMPEFLSFLGEIKNGNAPWRFTLMSGLIPAFPLIVIRPFLPESPVWAQKKAAGQLRRPSIRELFSPQYRRTTIVTTIVFACAYGAAFGAIQQIRQIVPGVPDVQEAIAKKPVQQQRQFESETAAFIGEIQELGGLT
ncbi:MAG: MFS transporter, partial [Pirellulales bacterium]